MTRRTVMAGLIFLLGLAGPSWAELIAYEGFDYAADSLLYPGRNGGTGWARQWVDYATPDSVIRSGSLPNTLVPSTGDYLDLEPSDGGQIYRQTSSALSLGEEVTYYMSYLIQPEIENAGRIYLNPNNWGNLWILLDNGKPGIYNGSADWGEQRTPQTDAFLMVLKVVGHETGADEFYLQMFGPSDTLVEPTTWEMQTTATVAAKTAGCVIYIVGPSGDYRANYLLDEIRIGTTWNDVVGVPEPASLALLAGGAVLGVRRRRRSA